MLLLSTVSSYASEVKIPVSYDAEWRSPHRSKTELESSPASGTQALDAFFKLFDVVVDANAATTNKLLKLHLVHPRNLARRAQGDEFLLKEGNGDFA